MSKKMVIDAESLCMNDSSRFFSCWTRKSHYAHERYRDWKITWTALISEHLGPAVVGS